ncbi:MAG: DUF547 domain-containing protein [Planctomycetes bacterium]|nr:DUF547 domain-containing protein [Planctomycetota bacterium]
MSPRFAPPLLTVLGSWALALASGCAAPAGAPVAAAAGSALDYSHYDFVLARHVRGGLINYAALLEDAEGMARWRRALEVFARVDPQTLPPADRKAFWTNAYNAFCIEGILRHWPVSKPTDIEGYFDRLRYRVGGLDLTVNEMQYEILMPEFKDARLHFVLVCADFGCRPLERTAFTGADIEARLEDSAWGFARDAGRFQVDLEAGVVRASKLFDWYAKDFTGDPQRPAATPVRYMEPWLTDAERELLREPDRYRVEIIPWDWRVNEWRAPPPRPD